MQTIRYVQICTNMCETLRKGTERMYNQRLPTHTFEWDTEAG